MNSQISFFRELPVTISFQGKLSFVRLAAGFSKPVDPLSGMTVNLVQVNQWLSDVCKTLSNQDQPDELQVLKFAQVELQKKAALVNASVTRVQLILECGTMVSWTSLGFEFQKKFWCTDESENSRLQIVATFPILKAAEVLQLEAHRVSDSFSTDPAKVFSGFSAQPLRIELENPISKRGKVFHAQE